MCCYPCQGCWTVETGVGTEARVCPVCVPASESVCVTPPDSELDVCVRVNEPRPEADDPESPGFPEPRCSSGTTTRPRPDDPEHTPTSEHTHTHTHITLQSEPQNMMQISILE